LIGTVDNMSGSAASVQSADDDIAIVSGYGDVDVGKYDEDGSFVGAYTAESPGRLRARANANV